MDDWKRGNYSEEDFNLDMSEIDKKLGYGEGEQKDISAEKSGGDDTVSPAINRKKSQKEQKQSPSPKSGKKRKKRGEEGRSGARRRPRLKLDLSSVQQGIIMKEILSPPRARSPHPIFRKSENRNL